MEELVTPSSLIRLENIKYISHVLQHEYKILLWADVVCDYNLKAQKAKARRLNLGPAWAK